MLKFVLLLLGLSSSLFAQGRLHEKTAMNCVDWGGWVSILGTWDKEGRPEILDMAYMPRWNPRLFSQQFGSHQIKFGLASGKEELHGVEVVRRSEGNRENWEAHVPLRHTYVSFRILGPGRKADLGKVEAEGNAPPRLRIWEEGSRLKWEVSEGWHIQVDATVNGGEIWKLLGVGKTGQGELPQTSLGFETVVRVQAFRGLRCYADIFIPGKGILDRPRPYLLPNYFRASPPDGAMSRNPHFLFTPVVSGGYGEYAGNARTCPNLEKLPFRTETLFPGRFVQYVFQAEWKNPPVPKERRTSFGMAQLMLRDPSRTKGLLFHRVRLEGTRWVQDALQNLCIFNADWEEPEVRGCERYRKPIDHDVNFENYYWVVTSDE